MLNEKQIQQIIKENESLQVQLDELNEILALREEEIELLKQNDADISLVRSLLEQEELKNYSLEKTIQKKDKEKEGAANRELDLENELIDSSKVLQRYQQLQQQQALAEVKLNDTELQIAQLRKENNELVAQLKDLTFLLATK